MAATHPTWVGISSSIPCIHVRGRSTTPFPLLKYRHFIASLSPTKVSTPETLTEIQRISLTTTSFNARRGAFSSEGGGEFEFGAFVYLPTTSFFLGGGAINTEQRK